MKFSHPVSRGTVAQGDESWLIVDGVVDLPEALGRSLDLRPAAEAPPPAHETPLPPQGRLGKKGR